MPLDPVRAADAKAWLAKAADDLRGAEVDLAARPPLVGDALFHCQQAGEKSLKAFLAWHDIPFGKTHSLEELGEKCLSVDRSLQTLIDEAVPLTEFAWVFRYPGEREPPVPKEATASLTLARKVFEAVRERLPQEARV